MEQKRGKGNRELKSGVQAGSRSGCFKKKGVWNPLPKYNDILMFGSARNDQVDENWQNNIYFVFKIFSFIFSFYFNALAENCRKFKNNKNEII